ASGPEPVGSGVAAMHAALHRYRPAGRHARACAPCPGTRPAARTAAPQAAAGLPALSGLVADVDDFVFAGPARRLDGHAVAGVLADQGARNRRRNGDQALLDVGLEVAD